MKNLFKITFFFSLSLSHSVFFFLQVVATDDERIAEICLGFGADVIMTSESCRNGKRNGST
jgi:hypothetical protein